MDRGATQNSKTTNSREHHDLPSHSHRSSSRPPLPHTVNTLHRNTMLFAARSAGTVALRGLSRQPPATLRQPARRMMGGGGHSPAPHPSQPKQAFLFNEGPGPRKVEIWEPITSIVYWSTLFILVIGLSSAPETRIKVCVGCRWGCALGGIKHPAGIGRIVQCFGR